MFMSTNGAEGLASVMEARPVKGRKEGELIMSEVAALWGYSTTQTWHMITQERVVPYRQDRNRIYVKAVEAHRFKAELPTSGRRRAADRERN